VQTVIEIDGPAKPTTTNLFARGGGRHFDHAVFPFRRHTSHPLWDQKVFCRNLIGGFVAAAIGAEPSRTGRSRAVDPDEKLDSLW